MARTVDLRRHTDAEGDVLTEGGIRAAVAIGGRIDAAYDVLISSGAQRATQTLACFLAGMDKRVPGGVTVDPRFRSSVETRWYAAARRADGKDLEAFRRVDSDLVEKEAALLGGVLRSVLEGLSDGGQALVVGHSPTTEAAVLGLTGQVIAPLSKGAGVRVVAESGGRYRVEPLEGQDQAS
jgi:phosphohistidine phosphatase SixA